MHRGKERRGALQDGRIVAAYGRRYLVELEDGTLLDCVTRGRRGALACGDRARIAHSAPGQGVIETLAARDTLLYRSDRGRQKLIAANVTQIVLAYNELLPQIPMYERFGNNAAWEGVRVKAWPADDDPILKNSPYGDGIPTMLLYTGRLEPV